MENDFLAVHCKTEVLLCPKYRHTKSPAEFKILVVMIVHYELWSNKWKWCNIVFADFMVKHRWMANVDSMVRSVHTWQSDLYKFQLKENLLVVWQPWESVITKKKSSFYHHDSLATEWTKYTKIKWKAKAWPINFVIGEHNKLHMTPAYAHEIEFAESNTSFNCIKIRKWIQHSNIQSLKDRFKL